MTRIRNINCPSQFDAGSSSQAARQLPFIQSFHSILYSISHQLPLSRRQKCRYLLSLKRRHIVSVRVNIAATKGQAHIYKAKMLMRRSRPT
ncbi:hypothetical protein LINGRAHAP2_LOCUS17383 [Linum grandiflorum]